MGSKKRRDGALLVASMICLAAVVSLASVTPARRQHAAADYEKAEQMHATLEARSQGNRTKNEYQKVIDAYFEVYRDNPAYGKAPVALTAIAELYQEMGHTFSSDTYFLEAIKSYRFLVDQYPQSRITREALFTIGDVYLRELEDPDEARKAFQYFLAMFPKSDEAPKAKERLKQIDSRLPEKSMAKATPTPSFTPAVPASLPIGNSVVEGPSNGLRQVTAVRRWVGPNYFRIVIGVDGETQFDSVRLSNPDRIVVNLQNARLSPDLTNKTFPLEGGFLKQIRVAQFSAGVARVVLDVEKIEAYSIFSLPNPFRLVIDVQGSNLEVAKAPKPVTTPETDSTKSAKVVPPVTAPPAGTPDATKSAHAESAASMPPTSSSPAKTDTASLAEPSTPVGYKEESPSQSPPAPDKPGKKSKKKDQTAPATADNTPPIQPPGPTESGSRTLTRALGLKIGRIVIDPGHGGHDTGTLGPTGLEEKEVVLDVGLKLRKLLEDNTGCEVVMTRSDDTFIPLEERTAIANEKSADLFISIHANASPDDSARGIETYYLNFTSNPEALEVAARENATSQEGVHQLQDIIKKIALTEKIEESEDFAKQVQHEVYTRVTKVSGAQKDRGIKKAPFVVLIGANMPSILAEISFLTNPHDEHLLKRPDYREKIAYALFEGIQGYLKTLGEVNTAQRVASSDQTSSSARSEF